MEMNKANGFILVKGIEEDQTHVTIKGIASSPSPDRVGDILEPKGVRFALPLPLLWMHDASAPVGQVVSAEATNGGVKFEAKLPIVKEEGTLKARIDEAVQTMKYGLINGVSVGFRALADGYEVMKNGGYRFKEWEWLELSIVSIPCNTDARIQAIKSFDSVSTEPTPTAPTVTAAKSKSGPVKLNTPRAEGKPTFVKLK